MMSSKGVDWIVVVVVLRRLPEGDGSLTGLAGISRVEMTCEGSC